MTSLGNNWKNSLNRVFCAHATWLVEESSLSSRRELVAWIMPVLSKAAAQELKTLLPFNTPAQIEAEKQLAIFLSTQELYTEVFRLQRTATSGRATDWAHTYTNALFDPPLIFSEVVTVDEPDLAVMRSLVTLAQKWQNLLVRANMPERAKKLTSALKCVRPGWRRAEALNERKLKRLERHAPDLATALRKAIYYWSNHRSEDDARAFQRTLYTAIEREDSTTVTQNTLLEIALMWSVARSAIGTESPAPRAHCTGNSHWKLSQDPLSIESADNLNSNVSLSLVCGKLHCMITKGIPGKQIANGIHQVDRAVSLAKSHGTSATGFNPDLVLHFTHDEHPGHLFAFGDAKNYQKSPIISAIKETGAAYLFAFAPLFGAPKHHNSPFDIEVAIRPAVTLFFPNDINLIAGVDANDTTALEELFRDSEYLPPILCMDRRHFIDSAYLADNERLSSPPNGTSTTTITNNTWDTPVLNAWFKRLTMDVHQAFIDQRAFQPINGEEIYDEATSRVLYIAEAFTD